MNKPSIQDLIPEILADYNDIKTGQSIKYLLQKYKPIAAEKLTLKSIKEILNDTTKSFTQKRQVLKTTTFIKWFAKEQGEILHSDIMFIPVKTKEQGTHSLDSYIPKSTKLDPYLIVVDIYSRYLWIYPLIKKSDIIEPFKQIIKEIRTVNPNIETIKILTDEGKEFFPLKKIEGIQHILSKSRFGAAVAEAHIKRIKTLTAYLNKFNLNYHDVALNLNTVNSNQKTPEGKPTTSFNIFNNIDISKQPTQDLPVNEQSFEVDDFVRVHDKIMNPLVKKSMVKHFSDAIYSIDHIEHVNGIKKYYVNDIMKNKILKQFYYSNELKKISPQYIENNY